MCVQSDPRMAGAMRRSTAQSPQVQIQVSGFEQWEPGGDLASAYDGQPGGRTARRTAGQSGWPETKSGRDGRFAGRRALRFRHELDYETGRYLGFLTAGFLYSAARPSCPLALVFHGGAVVAACQQ